MTDRRYLILDVFTKDPLTGNPLAVVLDCADLDTASMQRLAREFNLSETVFVLPPERPGNRARIRIFTPAYEMPFAGHPTVGSAVALATAEPSQSMVLEEQIGEIRCRVLCEGRDVYAEFELPRLPQPLALDADDTMFAAALGLDGRDIGFASHAVAAWSAGVPYIVVPVRNADALGRIRFNTGAWMKFAPDKGNGGVASAYIYCRDDSGNADFRARMFVSGEPSYEDPATGSAAAAFVGQVMTCERPADGTADIAIVQGVEMGRPSRIALSIDVAGGTARAARIGGHAVVVARGTLGV